MFGMIARLRDTETISASGRTLLSPCRDRDLNTFALAEGAFYHFGLLAMPKHARALLNWALVLEHVRRDAAQAGKCAVPYCRWRYALVRGFRICTRWRKLASESSRIRDTNWHLTSTTTIQRQCSWESVSATLSSMFKDVTKQQASTSWAIEIGQVSTARKTRLL